MLEKLYSRRRFGIRPGVGRVRDLLGRLGNPERSFRGIHVVGTNGKGSTTTFLTSILSAAGHRAARFTSPHLVNFSERFHVDGREPETDRLASLLERVLSLASTEDTFFEITTALGALLFAEERVEVAVLEAGMGGCSDATAAMPGMMTLITPISLDHCDYLGDSMELIATEKAAIIEPGTPVVCARQSSSVRDVIQAYCACGNSPLLREGDDFSATWRGAGQLDYRGIHGAHLRCSAGIPGRYQLANASLALAAAEVINGLGFCVSTEAMAAGLASARWPGRMELIEGAPRLLLDGAHNRSGTEALAEALADYHYDRLLLVIGVMADKDTVSLLAPLTTLADHCYCVAPAMERAMDPKSLMELVTRMGLTASSCGGVAQGIEAARRDARPNDMILVTGSLFTVGETKAWMTGTRFEGIRG